MQNQPDNAQTNPPRTLMDDNTPQPFRGPLKYEVETASPQLEAGRKASVFIRITNPYDVPVKVIYAHTEVPVEFKEVLSQTSWLRRLWKNALENATQENKNAAHENQYLVATSLSTPDNPSTQTKADGGPPPTVTLQPGNTTVYEFKLRTSHWLFFTPTTYNLNVQVQYEMKGIENHDTFKYQLNIRAPIKAQIYGSIIGSIVGTILHSRHVLDGTLGDLIYDRLNHGQLPSTLFLILVKFAASALLGAVLVVAFARKKDAQPFITVEDFWGGFFIGFLAGYVGNSLLNPYLPKQG